MNFQILLQLRKHQKRVVNMVYRHRHRQLYPKLKFKKQNDFFSVMN